MDRPILRTDTVIIAVFLNTAADANTFYYTFPEGQLIPHPDVCVVRQVTYNSSQINDAKMYHVWSDLTNDIIATFGHRVASDGPISLHWHFNSNPGTMLDLSHKQNIQSIQFMLMTTNPTVITDFSTTIPLVPVIGNAYVTCTLSLTLEFITFA